MRGSAPSMRVGRVGRFQVWGVTHRRVGTTNWRGACDWLLCTGAIALAWLCGLAFGNLFLGIPFHVDAARGVIYTGGLVNLLSPFALLCSVLSVTILILLGACYTAMKTGRDLARRAAHAGIIAAGIFVVAFIVAGVMVIFSLEGYRILGETAPRTVCFSPGAWLDNYIKWQWLWAAPLLTLLGALLACWLLLLRWTDAAFVASCIVPAGALLTAGFALFPFLMPSSENPNHSLTVWDVASTPTLRVVLFAVIALPLLLAYAASVTRVLRRGIGLGYDQN